MPYAHKYLLGQQIHQKQSIASGFLCLNDIYILLNIYMYKTSTIIKFAHKGMIIAPSEHQAVAQGVSPGYRGYAYEFW